MLSEIEKPPSTDATPSITPSDWSIERAEVLPHLDPGVAEALAELAGEHGGIESRLARPLSVREEDGIQAAASSG